MLIYDPKGNHDKYTNDYRHWSPQSETYTGADSLLAAQRSGWRILQTVYERTIYLRGNRNTSIYYFTLVRESERVVMPVMSNPFVQRMLTQGKMLVRKHTIRVVEKKTAPLDPGALVAHIAKR